MPYDFDRYAKELVDLVRLSDRPGWSPESVAKMYLAHAHQQGYHDALDAALRQVDEAFQAITGDVAN